LSARVHRRRGVGDQHREVDAALVAGEDRLVERADDEEVVARAHLEPLPLVGERGSGNAGQDENGGQQGNRAPCRTHGHLEAGAGAGGCGVGARRRRTAARRRRLVTKTAAVKTAIARVALTVTPSKGAPRGGTAAGISWT
jgi:hypothetical protein